MDRRNKCLMRAHNTKETNRPRQYMLTCIVCALAFVFILSVDMISAQKYSKIDDEGTNLEEDMGAKPLAYSILVQKLSRALEGNRAHEGNARLTQVELNTLLVLRKYLGVGVGAEFGGSYIVNHAFLTPDDEVTSSSLALTLECKNGKQSVAQLHEYTVKKGIVESSRSLDANQVLLIILNHRAFIIDPEVDTVEVVNLNPYIRGAIKGS